MDFAEALGREVKTSADHGTENGGGVPISNRRSRHLQQRIKICRICQKSQSLRKMNYNGKMNVIAGCKFDIGKTS